MIIELQPVLVYFVDNQRFPSELRIEERQPPLGASRIEPTPIQSNKVNPDSDVRFDQVFDRAEEFIWESVQARGRFVTDPLRRTRQGCINSLPSTQANLKKATRSVKQQEKRTKDLAELRARIIENLAKEQIVSRAVQSIYT